MLEKTVSFKDTEMLLLRQSKREVLKVSLKHAIWQKPEHRAGDDSHTLGETHLVLHHRYSQLYRLHTRHLYLYPESHRKFSGTHKEQKNTRAAT